MNFLTADWQHLLLANYPVSPGVLARFVPDGTRLDQFNGTTFVSLVAFRFANTRVLGMPVPFHVNFEEVNLRFYVVPRNAPERRAVTFVREIVPRAAIPLIANTLFSENYVSMRMSHSHAPPQIGYSWGDDLENLFTVTIGNSLDVPPVGSLDEFIAEHYWGYTKSQSRTVEYRVQHPRWKTSLVAGFQLAVDFGKLYGDDFAFLSAESPVSVLYADGSGVSVSFPKRV